MKSNKYNFVICEGPKNLSFTDKYFAWLYLMSDQLRPSCTHFIDELSNYIIYPELLSYEMYIKSKKGIYYLSPKGYPRELNWYDVFNGALEFMPNTKQVMEWYELKIGIMKLFQHKRFPYSIEPYIQFVNYLQTGNRSKDFYFLLTKDPRPQVVSYFF